MDRAEGKVSSVERNIPQTVASPQGLLADVIPRPTTSQRTFVARDRAATVSLIPFPKLNQSKRI
ncbi:hypothetical protein RSAG8_12074, partial [Rhizoctonia solani AG-8 WAC10335]